MRSLLPQQACSSATLPPPAPVPGSNPPLVGTEYRLSRHETTRAAYKHADKPQVVL